jgi:hypothetical protein
LILKLDDERLSGWIAPLAGEDMFLKIESTGRVTPLGSEGVEYPDQAGLKSALLLLELGSIRMMGSLLFFFGVEMSAPFPASESNILSKSVGFIASHQVS